MHGYHRWERRAPGNADAILASPGAKAFKGDEAEDVYEFVFEGERTS